MASAVEVVACLNVTTLYLMIGGDEVDTNAILNFCDCDDAADDNPAHIINIAILLEVLMAVIFVKVNNFFCR